MGIVKEVVVPYDLQSVRTFFLWEYGEWNMWINLWHNVTEEMRIKPDYSY